MKSKLVLESEKFSFMKVSWSQCKQTEEKKWFYHRMTGYQELLSDPSLWANVCKTYPLIGNYGLTETI